MSIDLSFKNLEILDQSLNLNNYVITYPIRLKTIINLQGNNFKGEQSYIQQLKVQHLNLSFNNIEQMWLLPSSLITLEINNNLLQNLSSIEIIAQLLDISHLKNLKLIDLSNNLLQSVHWFSNLTQLTHLFLKNNKVRYIRILQIKTIEQLRNLPQLIEVDLECNDLKNVAEVHYLETQSKINIINLFGNPVFEGLQLKILNVVEKNCHCRSEQIYTQSEIYKKRNQQIDDIDLFDEQASEKQSDLQPQTMTQKKYTKSLSPLNKQLPQFYDPKSSKYVTFHDVLRQKQRNITNTNYDVKQQNVTTTNTNMTINNRQTMDQLKQQNENLKKDYMKLKQKFEQSQKQNQSFFQEIESYKESLNGLLLQFNIPIQEDEASVRSLLDQLEIALMTFIKETRKQSIEQINSMMMRMGNKVKVMSSQIEITTLKKCCEYTEKIKNIELALSKLADVVVEQQYLQQQLLENNKQQNFKGKEFIHLYKGNA
ncbi:unnamed protein product (macronuclear) [Paramecium tetraurelia]|uniref:Leucine-rich repeat protein n=1 Tax=Paramecium tetraurelia TaxID=5888 RepID=A0CQ44_PARTE|nr:uncharacterized protein GSPATT00009259001 [Paramecium tetraurelia]CAK72911.1 unnamed protein product [Paramecium tetraurelia]|eukprot:XP_001440308.1 hypothetical protein (macronuclear) [Paramecium tetraurelia strain d4-2]